jgi:hypothetical protein
MTFTGSRFSSGVEHFLGREEVVSSNLTNGSVALLMKIGSKIQRLRNKMQKVEEVFGGSLK